MATVFTLLNRYVINVSSKEMASTKILQQLRYSPKPTGMTIWKKFMVNFPIIHGIKIKDTQLNHIELPSQITGLPHITVNLFICSQNSWGFPFDQTNFMLKSRLNLIYPCNKIKSLIFYFWLLSWKDFYPLFPFCFCLVVYPRIKRKSNWLI